MTTHLSMNQRLLEAFAAEFPAAKEWIMNCASIADDNSRLLAVLTAVRAQGDWHRRDYQAWQVYSARLINRLWAQVGAQSLAADAG